MEEFQREHRTGLGTRVFTDIVGSTALTEQLGDRQAVGLMQKHHALVRELRRAFADAEEANQPAIRSYSCSASPPTPRALCSNFSTGCMSLTGQVGASRLFADEKD